MVYMFVGEPLSKANLVLEQAKKYFWILCHKEIKARLPLSASALTGL